MVAVDRNASGGSVHQTSVTRTATGPVRSATGPTVAQNTQAQVGDQNHAQHFARAGMAPSSVSFVTAGAQTVTRATLIQGIQRDNGEGGLADVYNGSPRIQERINHLADIAIRVGQQEHVDPRILFSMAMQESAAGLNTRHSSSAQGVTGMMPSSAPNRSARRHLNDPEVCLTQTARYLKGQLVQELNARGYNVSAADLLPGTNNDNTKTLLLAYRYGSGGAHGQIQRIGLPRLIQSSDYNNVFRHMRDMGI